MDAQDAMPLPVVLIVLLLGHSEFGLLRADPQCAVSQGVLGVIV